MPPRDFKIEGKTKIDKVSLIELLASEKTKRSLTEFLMNKVVEYLKGREVDFVVAGNMETITSINGNVTNSVNNHEEADTLLLHTMTLVKSLIDDSAVYVYSADTDVFSFFLGTVIFSTELLYFNIYYAASLI